MTKRFAVLSVLTLVWTIIGDRRPEPSPSAKAYANSTASAFGQQPAVSNVTWEYRILLGNAFQLASLENSINKLAEQGYIVESFHPVSSVSGGRAQGTDSLIGVNSRTEIFVLLRRIRR